MKINLHSGFLDSTFLIVTGILIVVGSVGVLKSVCIPLSFTATMVFLGIKAIKGIPLKLPADFKTYILFLVILLTHKLLFGGEIIYFWMFLSGGLFWLCAYNLRATVKKYLTGFLVVLGLLMTGLFIYFRSRGLESLSPDNLFLPILPKLSHNHIGDLWAIILIPAIYGIVRKFNAGLLALTAVGLGVIGLSLSRSAVISLGVGTIFLIDKMKETMEFNLKQRKMLSGVLFGACFALFIYFGLFKPVLSSRPYFWEAITSLADKPLGIGMGNFANVSPETNVVHNLVLEVVTGLGLFSAIFIYWLYQILIKIFDGTGSNILFKAIWLALFVNFFFDSTYIIPGMLWIWFVTLSLAAE